MVKTPDSGSLSLGSSESADLGMKLRESDEGDAVVRGIYLENHLSKADCVSKLATATKDTTPHESKTCIVV